MVNRVVLVAVVHCVLVCGRQVGDGGESRYIMMATIHQNEAKVHLSSFRAISHEKPSIRGHSKTMLTRRGRQVLLEMSTIFSYLTNSNRGQAGRWSIMEKFGQCSLRTIPWLDQIIGFAPCLDRFKYLCILKLHVHST